MTFHFFKKDKKEEVYNNLEDGIISDEEKAYIEEYSDDDILVFDSFYGWRSKGWLKEHKKNKSKKKSKFKDSGFEDLGDDSYNYNQYGQYAGSYDYGFGTKFSDKNSKQTLFSDFEKTGTWHGYNHYQSATVEYRYIEQMANVLSAQHNIKVVPSNLWAIDIDNKILQYSPTSMMYGTKADVISLLLHEIGHLRHTTSEKNLSYTGIGRKYHPGAKLTLNAFEDIRIDGLMINSYASAPEVYESNKKTVQMITEKMNEKNEFIKKNTLNNFGDLTNLSRQEIEQFAKDLGLDKDALLKMYDEGFQEFSRNIIQTAQKKQAETTLLDYLVELNIEKYSLTLNLKERKCKNYIEKTIGVLPSIEKSSNTQDVLNQLESRVFPVIEDLLKKYKGESENNQNELDRAFDKISEKVCETIEGENGEAVANGKLSETSSRNQQKNGTTAGKDTVPKEWYDGDYEALRQSVDSGVRELTRLLRNIRVKDLTQKWEMNLKRGKLDVKHVYRYKSGRDNIFKKQQLQEDRTTHLSFSMLLDISGSMEGRNIIHSTRGLIMLAETFKNLNIPFEIIKFDSNAYIIKGFNDEYSETIKKHLSGAIKSCRGGTDLSEALTETKISSRPEINKNLVVLSDGETCDEDECRDLSKEFIKNGVSVLGFAIEMNKGPLQYSLGDGNTQEIDKVEDLPKIFYQTLKDIIKKL